MGGYSEIRYAKPVAATRVEALGLINSLRKSLDNLQDDVLAEGFVFAEKVAADWIGDKLVAMEDKYMQDLREKLGEDAAKKFASYMNDKAYGFGRTLGEISQGTATRKDFWELLRSDIIDILKAIVPGKYDIVVDFGVSGLSVGDRVFTRAVEIMHDSIREALLHEADLALQDRSLIIVRKPFPNQLSGESDFLL